MTLGTVAAIEARGLRIPEDVALVGFDDAVWADVLHPRLTTIAQPTYELGRTAADLLLRRIERPGRPGAAADGDVRAADRARFVWRGAGAHREARTGTRGPRSA